MGETSASNASRVTLVDGLSMALGVNGIGTLPGPHLAFLGGVDMLSKSSFFERSFRPAFCFLFL